MPEQSGHLCVRVEVPAGLSVASSVGCCCGVVELRDVLTAAADGEGAGRAAHLRVGRGWSGLWAPRPDSFELESTAGGMVASSSVAALAAAPSRWFSGFAE